MNRSFFFPALAGLSLAAVTGALIYTSDPTPDPAVEASEFPSSKVAWDGGTKVYLAEVEVDGGTEIRTLAEAPCKRRLPDSNTCYLDDGGLPLVMRRYPAAELSGICEGVACSVWAGEDSDAPETKP